MQAQCSAGRQKASRIAERPCAVAMQLQAPDDEDAEEGEDDEEEDGSEPAEVSIELLPQAAFINDAADGFALHCPCHQLAFSTRLETSHLQGMVLYSGFPAW